MGESELFVVLDAAGPPLIRASISANSPECGVLASAASSAADEWVLDWESKQHVWSLSTLEILTGQGPVEMGGALGILMPERIAYSLTPWNIMVFGAVEGREYPLVAVSPLSVMESRSPMHPLFCLGLAMADDVGLVTSAARSCGAGIATDAILARLVGLDSILTSASALWGAHFPVVVTRDQAAFLSDGAAVWPTDLRTNGHGGRTEIRSGGTPSWHGDTMIAGTVDVGGRGDMMVESRPGSGAEMRTRGVLVAEVVASTGRIRNIAEAEVGVAAEGKGLWE